MPKRSKDSEKNETKWTAIAVTPETHRQIKIAAAVANIQISEFMAHLATLAPEIAEKLSQGK